MSPQKKINDIVSSLRNDWGVKGTVQCVEQLTWILFLKFLDCYESRKLSDSELSGKIYKPILKAEYRWSNWACPKKGNGKPDESKALTGTELVEFVNQELFPHLRSHKSGPADNPNSLIYRMSIIFRVFPNRIASGDIMREVLNRVDEIDFNSDDDILKFSQDYADLIERMCRDSVNATEFYTPRPLVRAIVNVMNPLIGEKVFDPAAGTCGFLVESHLHSKAKFGKNSQKRKTVVENESLVGCDRSPFAYLLGSMNMTLHGITVPILNYGDVFSKSKARNLNKYDVILSNIPFGYEVADDLKCDFPVKHRNIALLYFQLVCHSLNTNGRAAVVVPESILRKNDKEYRQVWSALLKEFNLHTVLILPPGVFLPYSNIKSNVLFFERTGKATSNVWYYECNTALRPFRNEFISDRDLEEFVELYPVRKSTERSWMVPVSELKKGCDLSPKNPMRGKQAVERKTGRKRLKSLDEEKMAVLLKESRDLFQNRLGEWFAQIRNRKKIDEIATVKGGNRLPNGAAFLSKSAGYPYIRIADFSNGGSIDASNVQHISKDVYEKLKSYSLTENDLCISIVGTIGKTCIVPSEFNGAILTENAARLKVRDRNELDVRYLHLFTLTPNFKEQVELASDGVAQLKLALGKLKKVFVPVCNFDQQLELVSSVWSIKSRIDRIEIGAKDLSLLEDSKIGSIRIELEGLIESIKQMELPKSNEFMKDSAITIGSKHNGFEINVKSSALVKLLARDKFPGMPNKKIKGINFQGKADGYLSNDLIMFFEDTTTLEQSKYLAQIRQTIEIEKNDSNFAAAMDIAWKDFNNADVFKKGRDAIAIVTESLNPNHRESTQFLLENAVTSMTPDEFYEELELPFISPADSMKTLSTFRYQLKQANGGNSVSDEELYFFLRSLYIFEFSDTWKEKEIQPLLNSNGGNPQLTWSKIVEFVLSADQIPGVVGLDEIPEELQQLLKPFEAQKKPLEVIGLKSAAEADLLNHPASGLLALLVLIGSWNERNENDIAEIEEFLGLKHKPLLLQLGDLLQMQDSPVSIKNGIWIITSNKLELLKKLGGRISLDNIKEFSGLVARVLKCTLPEFEMPPELSPSGYSPSQFPKYSEHFRKGISEGIALIGNCSSYMTNCSQSETANLSQFAVENILDGADWKLWSSLNDYLPNLAEAAPLEFMHQVKLGLRAHPSPFDEMLARNNPATGINLTGGLNRSLEILAWDSKYFQDACSILCELHSPDDSAESNAINSLVKILMPWSPQTTASLTERILAMESILEKDNDLGWQLLLRLIPFEGQISTGTSKPRWSMTSLKATKQGKSVQTHEFLEQVKGCAKIAIENVNMDVERILQLIEHLKDLPDETFEIFADKLNGNEFKSMPEDETSKIWVKLKLVANRHKRYSGADWAFSKKKLDKLENTLKKLEPQDTSLKFQYLFSNSDTDLLDEKLDFDEQEEKLEKMRKSALKEILNEKQFEGILGFAKDVDSPATIGLVLASMDDDQYDREIVPKFLVNDEKEKNELARGYIWKRQKNKGWKWVDEIVSADWLKEEQLQFLLCLPSGKNTWDRVQSCLQNSENSYWDKVDAWISGNENLEIAVEKFLKYGRPKSAVACLGRLIRRNNEIDCNLIVRALLEAANSNEEGSLDQYSTVELIKRLQSISNGSRNEFHKVEWEYLSFFGRFSGERPILLERKLASDPEFFCEKIQQIYRSTKGNKRLNMNSNKRKSDSKKAHSLLDAWRIVPGTDSSGKLNLAKFKKWIQKVREQCEESGHLEVAMIHIGRVLSNSPKGEGNGLWINKSIAEFLNEDGNNELRNGYRNGILDYTSVHLGPEGASANQDATVFRQQAEAVKSAGFQKFSSTLHEIADDLEEQVKSLSSILETDRI